MIDINTISRQHCNQHKRSNYKISARNTLTLSLTLIGALSGRPYPFTLRPWEHLFRMSLDHTNSFAQYLKVGIVYKKVKRSLPSFINEYDEETPWINDKTRFSFEGAYATNKRSNYKNKRKVLFIMDIVVLMYFYDHISSQLTIRIPNIFFVFGNSICLELLSLLHFTLSKYTFLKLRTFNTLPKNNDLETHYQINESIKNYKQLLLSDLCLLIGTNTRYESSYLNLKLRKRYIQDEFEIVSFSSFLDITLPMRFLGSTFKKLTFFSSGNNLENQNFMLANNPIIILNSEFFSRKDSNSLFSLIESLKTYTFFTYKNWNGLNVLNNSLNDVGINSINKFVNIKIEDLINFKVFFFLDIPFYSLHLTNLLKLKTLRIVYSEFDTSSHKKKLEKKLKKLKMSSKSKKQILGSALSLSLLSYSPIFSYKIVSKMKRAFKKIKIDRHFNTKNFFETSGTFQNAEGFLKKSLNVISSKNTVQENWKFLRLVSKSIKNYFFFTNSLKNNLFIEYELNNIFRFKNYIALRFFAIKELTTLAFFYVSESSNSTFCLIINKFFSSIQKNYNSKFKFWIDDFFQGGQDLYSIHSKTMVLCSKILREKSITFFAI